MQSINGLGDLVDEPDEPNYEPNFSSKPKRLNYVALVLSGVALVGSIFSARQFEKLDALTPERFIKTPVQTAVYASTKPAEKYKSIDEMIVRETDNRYIAKN